MDKTERDKLTKEFIKYTKDDSDFGWLILLTFLSPLLLLFLK